MEKVLKRTEGRMRIGSVVKERERGGTRWNVEKVKETH